jgi:hypothetical protein
MAALVRQLSALIFTPDIILRYAEVHVEDRRLREMVNDSKI